jgi:hypothetical protein
MHRSNKIAAAELTKVEGIGSPSFPEPEGVDGFSASKRSRGIAA